jgi:SAM-dependent methyltransferase
MYGQRQKDTDHVAWWNRRAEGFAARYGGRKENDPRVDILGMIHGSSFFDPEAEMLDIGCGPGNYAIPLSRGFKKIVALDSSPKMLSILEERAGKMGISNIETVCTSWEDVDLDKMGWRGKFGLVAAIKSPGIRDARNLEKMIAASGAGCLFNGFITREDSSQADIWRLVFGEEKPPVPADAFYVYHLAHAMGYLPSIRLRRYLRETREDIGTADRELNLLMSPYEDPAGLMGQEIRRYVMEQSAGGKVRKTCRSEEGTIIWSIKDQSKDTGGR